MIFQFFQMILHIIYLKDDQTLIMISAVKSLQANFKFDIASKESWNFIHQMENLIL